MFSLDLESQILALAHSKGLLTMCPPDPGHGPVQGLWPWSERLGSLISSGALSSHSVQALAWEALLLDPPKGFLEVGFLQGCEEGGQHSPSRPPASGSRYTELSLLGEGATARVYKAFDTVLRRWVALKYLKGTLPDLQASILSEARAQAHVEHPNICRIYEVGEEKGRPFIAMQLVEGPTLTEACDGMALETKLEVMRDLAEGIHRAHRKGLVHLDLKLGNVLVEPLEEGGWHPYLTDFGMVRSTEIISDRPCPMGTPPYSSPEQLAGDINQVDRRSDIYSLGVMVHVLLARSFPFEANSFQELLQAIQDHKVLPLRQARRDLSPDLEAIVSKCMARDPKHRYDSAQAFADDLQHFLDGEPVQARQYSLHHHLWTWISRNRGRLLGGAAALLAILGTAYLWHGARATSRTVALRLLTLGRTGPGLLGKTGPRSLVELASGTDHAVRPTGCRCFS